MDYYDEVPEFSLTITEGGEEGQRFVFNQLEITLGRIADNDLVLYDPAVSRRHIVISHRNDQFVVEDLKSSNGTLLNGYALASPTILCEGDFLEVGSVKFRFSKMVEESDDPTEVEVPVSGNMEDYAAKYIGDSQQPVARHRWEAGVSAPMPPQGDTRAFPAPNIPPTSPPQQQLAPLPLGAGLPNDAIMQREMNSPHLYAENPSNMGISAPSMTHPHSAQFSAPRPSSPAPFQGNSSSSLKQLQNKHKPNLLREKRTIQQISLWSVMLLGIAIALFLFPAKPSKNMPIVIKQKPIVLNQAIYQKVFGYNQYNKKGQSQPMQVTFRFFCGNERIALLYRVISPHSSIMITLNGKLLAQIPPTSNVWLYQRHRLPRSKIIPFRMNTIVFRKISTVPYRIWGLTHISLRKKALPMYNLGKAMRFCKQAENFYYKRKSLPHYREKSIYAYLQCQDYLARKKPLPQLFKEADLMILRLESELELIFQQYLQKANMIKRKQIKVQLYKQMLSYFPYDDDPRRQRVKQLIRLSK